MSKEGVIALGVFLRNKRLSWGYTTRDVHEKAGLSTGYLSRVETGSGKGPPSLRMLKKFADLYEVSLAKLLEISGMLEISSLDPEADQCRKENAYFDTLILSLIDIKRRDLCHFSPYMRRAWKESLCKVAGVTSIFAIPIKENDNE